MKIFCGGQIIPEARGDKALIFHETNPKVLRVDERYDALTYKIDSDEELARVTSAQAMCHWPIGRAYLGVNEDYAVRLATGDMSSFEDLDKLVLPEGITPFNIFFGGQIRRENRGNLALVVSKVDSDSGLYVANSYQPNSNEFIFATDPENEVAATTTRVYFGVNERTARKVVTISSSLDRMKSTLEDLDRALVEGCFIKPRIITE